MDPLFSEFSYGYALTEELARGRLGFRARPIFPSLRQEGQPGGGFDVQLLPRRGSPLFLQFKRSHYLKRVYSAKWDIFHGPYFRMPLMSSRYSMQHELLIYLELDGNNDVYYVAPEFYTDDDLADHYWNRVVFENSAFFRPTDIGHLADDDPHYVVYDNGLTAWVCSDEPAKIRKVAGGRTFSSEYSSTSRQKASEVNDEFFDRVTDGMLKALDRSTIGTERLKTLSTRSVGRSKLADKVELAAFVSRSYFNAELFIATEE